MRERVQVDFYACLDELQSRMRDEGVLCTVADGVGKQNVLTLGWGLFGPHYVQDRPIMVIAVTPRRFSWRFLEAGPDFVIAVPDDRLRSGVELCGTASGRDLDKFAAAGLTPVPSLQVSAPSVAECPLNIECRIYCRVQPPHMLLTPSHRTRPIAEQHTIYFAEVLGAYRWA
jgi:flavin reductase (DIM6/NTAB) family NADH-FMN oxidoreductase RutF